MARARNIKPSIMDNEELAELDPLDRLLFVYLWMLADREGRLEDRPKRIAKQALAYDRDADAEEIITRLAEAGFVKRYAVHGMPFLQVINFVKHQAPHGTEKDSAIPNEAGFLTVHQRGKTGYATGNVDLVPCPLTVIRASQEAAANSASTVKPASTASVNNSASTVGAGVPAGGQNPLIPDSGFLIPDSPIPEKNTPLGGKPPLLPGFLRFWSVWPKHFRKEARGECLKAWNKAGAEAIADAIVAHVERKKHSQEWTKAGGEYIPAPLVYLNKRRWEGAEDGNAAVAAGDAGKPWEGAR
jgi:hypothetical protein